MPVTPDQITAYTAAVIAGVAAVYERLRNNKVGKKSAIEEETLSDAKRQEERASLMAKMADEYRALYAAEASEHLKTREFWHGKATEHQAALFSCQEKILELQARPDLSDILSSIKMQGEVSLQILAGIKQVLDHLPGAAAPRPS